MSYRAHEKDQGSRGRAGLKIQSRARRPLRKRVYWILFGLRTLSCAPSAFAVWEYVEDARKCYVATGSITACSFNTWLPAIWCIVSGYMTWLGLRGMILRWVFTYNELAAVFRVITCVLINYLAISTLTHFRHSRGTTNMIDLQIWILISVLLTTLYTLQTFITSDLGQSKRGKTLDLFHIAVYAVIPIGLASFLTMIALIRNLMLVQLYFANS